MSSMTLNGRQRGEDGFVRTLVITTLVAADRDGGIVVFIRLGVSSVKVLDREVTTELKVAVQKRNKGVMPFSATSDGGSQLLVRQVRSNRLSNFGQVHAERKVDGMDFFLGRGWGKQRRLLLEREEDKKRREERKNMIIVSLPQLFFFLRSTIPYTP